jgi:branched-chain amino acid transport system substrate-binding protein
VKSFVLLFIGILLNQYAYAVPLRSKVVSVGLASNFTEVSPSSSNPFGGYFRDGVQLALKDAQKKLKAKGIEVTTKDFDYGTADARVLSAAKDAVASDVVAVLGYNWSSQALLAAPIHQAGKLPMITPSATANRIGSMGKYVHQGCFDNAFMGETLASVATKRLKAKTAVIVAAADCAYCTDLASAFEKEFKVLGGTVVASLPILQSDKSFATVVEKLRAEKFDVVLVPNQELLSARIIAALHAAGIQKPFLGGDGWGNVGEEFFAIIGKEKINGYSTSHWHPQEMSARSKKFAASYVKAFGKEPNDTSVLAYDSMSLLIDAILAANSLSREGVEESLARLSSYNGVTGKFIFSSGRAPKKSLVLLSISNSKFKVADRIEPSERRP